LQQLDQDIVRVFQFGASQERREAADVGQDERTVLRARAHLSSS
jgi:hypothetical protein